METIPINVPVAAPTKGQLRGDWRNVIELTMDSPSRKEVRIVIPGTQASQEIKAQDAVVAVPKVEQDLSVTPRIYGKNAVIGRPAIAYRAAIPATVTLPLIVWSGDAYDAAQIMRNGEGWGQSDLIAAIEALLQNMLIK